MLAPRRRRVDLRGTGGDGGLHTLEVDDSGNDVAGTLKKLTPEAAELGNSRE